MNSGGIPLTTSPFLVHRGHASEGCFQDDNYCDTLFILPYHAQSQFLQCPARVSGQEHMPGIVMNTLMMLVAMVTKKGLRIPGFSKKWVP